MMLELIEKFRHSGDTDDTLTLPYERRQRSRQRVRLDSGREAMLLLAPGTSVFDGDHLHAADGTSVRVSAAAEAVSTARSDDPLRLARACYHLGNRHVALQVGSGWVRYQPDHVLDEMVAGLGLEVIHETSCFEPERGAYHGHAEHHRVLAGSSTGAHPVGEHHH